MNETDRRAKSERTSKPRSDDSSNLMPQVFDLIDSIGKRGQRIVAQTLSEAGLTPAQYLVLANLQQADGRPLGEIADALRCSKPTITGIADTMERKGLVTREPNPGDRRSHLLRLTAKGKALLRETPELEGAFAGCTMGMEAAEFRRLRDLLRRLDECMRDSGVGA
jgi:DNA-binding MarR family transcriptional regulator